VGGIAAAHILVLGTTVVALPSPRQNALVWPSRWHFLENLGGPGIYGLGMNLIPFRKISLGAGPSNSKATVGVSILVGPLSVLNR
jgi:hypothetical protein